MFKKNNKSIGLFATTIIIAATSLFAAKEQNISLRVEPEYVSPNGDGLNDQVFFYPVLESDVIPKRWRLNIRNQKGKRVHRITGPGVTALIKWDLMDSNGLLSVDGVYSAQLEMWTDKGHAKTAPRPFFIDTVIPLVDVSLSTPTLAEETGAKIIFHPTIQDDSGIERWQFQVISQQGKTMDIQWSTETVHDIVWDGKSPETGILFPQGPYTCIYQAWDQAGNQSDPVTLNIKIEATPSESLRGLLQRILVYETPIGLITPLPARDIFQKQKKKIMLSTSGDAMLKEVALLVNAYPQNSVRLDGYSTGLKKGDKNRDLSSIYAWTVYSHLVKKGNVKASRITVRGRGKSPMFDRRSVQPEIMKDGVEVIIEGNQKW